MFKIFPSDIVSSNTVKDIVSYELHCDIIVGLNLIVPAENVCSQTILEVSNKLCCKNKLTKAKFEIMLINFLLADNL